MNSDAKRRSPLVNLDRIRAQCRSRFRSLSQKVKTAMTPERRMLRFSSLDEVMPEVERLRNGHTTVGNWTLAQICRHLATVLRRVADLPASTPRDPSQELGEERKREVLETRPPPRRIARASRPSLPGGRARRGRGGRESEAGHRLLPVLSGPRRPSPPVRPADPGRVAPAPVHPLRPSPRLRDPGRLPKPERASE